MEAHFQAALAACAAAFFGAPSWPERVWEGGRVLTEFFAAKPQESHLAFIEPHAIGDSAVQVSYERLSAFTLFAEEGYSFRPRGREIPRLASEALAAVMFELAYRELRERRSAEMLPRVLPEVAYMILAPFMGPEAASEFVEGKVRDSAAGRRADEIG